MLAKEIADKFESSKQGTVAKALAAGAKGPEGFYHEWGLLVPYCHDIGHTLTPLTGKQRGMLSQFRKKVGVIRAPEVLLWAIREWNGGFARQVLELYHQTLPNRPEPGYLLKYADAALSGWSAGPSKKAAATVQLAASQPVLKKYVVK